MTPPLGIVGIGLMGHGMAKNIVEKGYPLTVTAHRNRAPVDDLLTRGAAEASLVTPNAGYDIERQCAQTSVHLDTQR